MLIKKALNQKNNASFEKIYDLIAYLEKNRKIRVRYFPVFMMI
jgi:hypothetical protein